MKLYKQQQIQIRVEGKDELGATCIERPLSTSFYENTSIYSRRRLWEWVQSQRGKEGVKVHNGELDEKYMSFWAVVRREGREVLMRSAK